ncbi:hypothetical protein NL108_001324 [Boleophthalmus pectinirostris]|uniref:UBX domain-containing protein 11 n=1 Tax=Boleophthalmus pectinirostris TaxID=150288 RepID=UPI000A1C4A93|nr:UBX domain-containing protein 11 [Boleophthalmus pectinirostris]KAJ0047427.1 hypothetical protein NL108_001324 [Boleophthalmus pectinirostris]
MSSPLSTLKKMKRTPLPQWEKPDNHPKRNPLREFQVAADHGSSISDPNPPGTPNAPHITKMSQKKGSPSSPEPRSAVLQQLSCLEQRVRAQAEEICQKDKRISALEEALRVKKEIFERRYIMLQRQVIEMESFLMDYDMIWVGSENTDAKECEQAYNFKGLWTPSGAPADRRFHFNFDLVLEKIQELNILAGEGETYIQTTTTGAQLAQQEPVELWLYQNGIVMFDGPFRTYREQKTQQFMQDLMDGYFPSELQERFPDGVPFEVHDRRNEQFIPKQQKKTFPGHGHVIRKNNGKNSFNAAPEGGKKLGQGERAGQVMTIREGLEGALQVTRSKQGSSDAHYRNLVTFVDTPALQSFQAKSQCRESSVITLKIRSEDGDHIYMLKMNCSETIGHVRQYLDKHREGDMSSYDIVSVSPRCSFDDDSQTIRACGLTANTSLLLRPRPATPVMKQQHEVCKNI